jgi:hypothetical protein
LNQAAQAFTKAAELEYGRAGGKQAAQQDDWMPDLAMLLEKMEAERRQPRTVGVGMTMVRRMMPIRD